jgi:DNA-binding MurR/RpiR family transcriptional regulator
MNRSLSEVLAGAAPGTTSPAESRVLQVVVGDPQLVAFGTMADLVQRAGVGAGTVARLCAKLGLTGFAELQRLAQQQVVASPGSASERIRATDPNDLAGRIAEAEQRNVALTFDQLDRSAMAEAARLAVDLNRHLVVMASDAANGIARQFALDLASLRPQVEFLDGNPVTVGRRLALGDGTDVLLVVDVHRYDSWLIDTTERFAAAGADVIAITDNPRSNLARLATVHLGFHASSPGPFDSFTAALALLNALNALAATELTDSATERLELLERTWRATKALEN